MRRVWRFILALSVTPVMTAACLAILGWMAWQAGSVERGRTSGWHVGKLLNGQMRASGSAWSRALTLDESDSQPTETLFGVIESGDVALVVDEDTASRFPGQSAIIHMSDEPCARYGAVGITRVDRAVEAHVFNHVKRVWYPDEVMASLAAKCAKVSQLHKYAEAIRTGRGYVTEVQWSGYAYNLLAILITLIFARSLQWTWRGARMPWGSNQAWKIAAIEPSWTWWFWRVSILSPMATLVLGLSFAAMLMVNWKPIWNWQYELRSHLYQATNLLDMSQFDATTIPQFRNHLKFGNRTSRSAVLWLNDAEKEEWDKRGVWIRESPLPRRDVFAPMTTIDVPAVIILNTPSNRSDDTDTRTLVEDTMISRGVITPEQAPLLWTVQPKRIVWQGVLFNSIMLAVAGAFLASLVWLRDGVVWPWNARRLRQGLCQKCSYSLSGLSVAKCPECGKQVSSLA